MSITVKDFGKLNDGRAVTAYTMSSKCGIEITILDLGGIIQSIKMPGKDGTVKDVVCGYDTAQEYIDNSGYNGALIGRYANRIKNGQFELNGTVYNIPKNEKGITALHGGEIGWDKKTWAVETGKCQSCGADKLTLTYTSVDGEQGFPGNVDVKVVYRLDDNGEFVIKYHAISDKDTPIAMTNHAYFNMAGYDTRTIRSLSLHLTAVSSLLSTVCLSPPKLSTSLEPLLISELPSLSVKILTVMRSSLRSLAAVMTTHSLLKQMKASSGSTVRY